MQFKIGIILCLVVLESVFAAVIEPIVEIKQGKLKGKVGESRNGRRYAEYLGIPYAQKPQRFQEAIPSEKWTGIRDATKFGSPCAQFDRKTKGVVGSEDCLFLNVYTPVATPPPSATTTSTTTTTTSKPTSSAFKAPTPPPRRSLRKLPVLVYIHGGSFVSQSGQLFGGNYFMDEEVVLVTLNYRLGVLGFLSTGDSASIANLGLRDQILALKWIQENIEKFGGDATKVTLVGGSAGGALANYLMLSPLTKGLFSSVISQSGNAICPWVIVRHPEKVAEKLATKLNCPTKSSQEIMTCIKGKSLKDIEIARVALQGFSEDPAVPFAPVVEKWAKDKAVVPDTPQKLISQGKAAHIPWLTGYNSLNGLNLGVAGILTTPKRLAQVDKEWNKLAPLLFHYSQSAPYPGNVSAAIRQYYFGHGMINDETKEKLIIALTDRNFISCTAEAALAQSKYGPVYIYTMSYQSHSSFLDEWGVREKIKMRGVVHNDELPFLFNLGFQSLPEFKKGDKSTPFSEKLVKLWAEFAKSGKPIERTDKMDYEWSPVLPSQTTSSLKWYQLDSPGQSQAITIPSPTFKVWEGQDLGPDEDYLRTLNDRKIAVGYEMTDRPTVKPITLPPLKGPGGLPYGLAPPVSPQTPPPAQVGTSTSKSSSVTPTSPKQTSTTEAGPPPPIHAIFKDEDPYSSTTTTTTKKPGFFSKIIG